MAGGGEEGGGVRGEGSERGGSRSRREKKHQRDGFCAVASAGRKDRMRSELLSLPPKPPSQLRSRGDSLWEELGFGSENM